MPPSTIAHMCSKPATTAVTPVVHPLMGVGDRVPVTRPQHCAPPLTTAQVL
jgi:hypothetical protein